MSLSKEVTARWAAFSDLSLQELYDLLKLRQDVFILEQASLYGDIDGKDQEALHYLIHDSASGVFLGAIRMFVEPAQGLARIGRVVIAQQGRGIGLGRAMMQAGIDKAGELSPGCEIHVRAQSYLERFYGSLGFRTVSAEFIEDGIPHIDMVRA